MSGVEPSEIEASGGARQGEEQPERAVPGPMAHPDETHERPTSVQSENGETGVGPAQSRRLPDRPQSLPTRSRSEIRPEAGANVGPTSSSQRHRQDKEQSGSESGFEERGPPIERAQQPNDEARVEFRSRPNQARPETEPERPAVRTDANSWWPFTSGTGSQLQASRELAERRPNSAWPGERPSSETSEYPVEPHHGYLGRSEGHRAERSNPSRPTFEEWTQSMRQEEERAASRDWAEELGRRQRADSEETADRVGQWARGYDEEQTVGIPEHSSSGHSDVVPLSKQSIKVSAILMPF